MTRISYFRIILVVLIVSFAILTFLVRHNPYFPFDLVITRMIQTIKLPGFDPLMRFLSWLGIAPVAIVSVALFAAMFFYLKKVTEAKLILLSSFGAIVLSESFKALVQRPRPDPTLILQIEHFNRPDSFPSGHVLFFIGLYGFLLFLVHTKLKQSYLKTALLIILSLLLILIGFSRIYLGSHWFSDVLGSYLIGTAWLLVVVNFLRKI